MHTTTLCILQQQHHMGDSYNLKSKAQWEPYLKLLEIGYFIEEGVA